MGPRTFLKSLRSDRSGAIAVIVALVSPALLGFAGLAAEAGVWYVTREKMQYIADAAAFAGARELAAGTGKVTEAATSAAQLNGCTGKCSIDPPSTFKYGDSPVDNGVQVVAKTTLDLLIADLFINTASGTIDINATGKAVYEDQTTTVETTTGGGAGCILGLDPNAPYTVWLKNNAVLNCGVMSNSKCQGPNSPTCALDATVYGAAACSPSVDPQCGATLADSTISSLYLWNNAKINSDAAAAGAITLANNAAITGLKLPNANQVTDPYGAVSISVPTATAAHTVAGGVGNSGTTAIDISVPAGKCSTGALTYANKKYLKIHPGCYNGWDFQNKAYIVLDAGTYYIKTKFVLGNTAYITAPAVFNGNNAEQLASGGTTLVFVGTGNSSYAINVGNNAYITLRAPNTGTLKGIALMGDPAGKATVVQTFSNNAILNIKGAIYFRTQIINMENNAISDSDGCLQLIGRRVLFSNNAVIGDKCGDIGTAPLSIGNTVSTTTTTVINTNLVQ